jgi:hypothetical protein
MTAGFAVINSDPRIAQGHPRAHQPSVARNNDRQSTSVIDPFLTSGDVVFCAAIRGIADVNVP